MDMGVEDFPCWCWIWYHQDYPTRGTSAREEYYGVSCAGLESSIKMRGSVAVGDIVALIYLVSNMGNTMFLGRWNGHIRKLGGGNDNMNSSSPRQKSSFPCLFLLLFLYVKNHSVYMNRTLEIHLCLLSNFYIDNIITSDLISPFLFIL